MANDQVAINTKETVTSFTSKSTDTIFIWLQGDGLKQITFNDFLTEIGGILKDTMPDRGAVSGLASLDILDLTDGEIRVVTDPGTIYVWDENMTPAEAGDYYDTVTPGNKANPTTTNGFWYALGSKKPTATPVSIVGGTATIDWDDNELYTVDNTEAGGLTIAITNVLDGAPETDIQVTTNTNPLTTVTGLDSLGGTYRSDFAVMTLTIRKRNGRTYGIWQETAYGVA